ncbi:MAG: DUF308 domain-containing protein [Tannerellaceae bacterium]|nr:DUF308 domain-containing protein [Tannerellaceae bacterium]
MFTVTTLHHSLLRSILGIVLGLLFIVWPQESVTYLIITAGIFFVLAGLCSILIRYFSRDRSMKPLSPLTWSVAAGSIILGAWLLLSPLFFVAIFGIVWGGILTVAGIQQLASLVKARKWHAVGPGYYVLPALILVAGILILVYPLKTIVDTFVLLGAVSLFYGLNELVSWYKFRPKKAEEEPPVETVEAEEV